MIYCNGAITQRYRIPPPTPLLPLFLKWEDGFLVMFITLSKVRLGYIKYYTPRLISISIKIKKTEELWVLHWPLVEKHHSKFIMSF